MKIVIILILILIISIIIIEEYLPEKNNENFKLLNNYQIIPRPLFRNYFFDIAMNWLNPTRSTRNMSYDLRGDIPIINTIYNNPWNLPSRYPINNKKLSMIS